MENYKSKRIAILDEIRGTAVILMVLYHALYNLANIFGSPLASRVIFALMPYNFALGAVFITISGIVSQFSRSNLKRGLKLLPIALIITAVTYFFMPEMRIMFGILHFLSFAMIYFGLTQKFHNKISPFLGMALSALLWLCTYQIQYRKFAFFITLPSNLYQTNFLFPFGIYSSSFFSSDYFPIFPWIFIFLFGTYLGKYAKENRLPNFMYKSHIPFLSYIGRHALIIYVVHQPVLYTLFWIIYNII